MPGSQRRSLPAVLLGLAMVALVAPAAAQNVSLAGSMGDKALLVIDGQPHTVRVGDTVRGVTLVNLSGQRAEVRRQGDILFLNVGASPVQLGAGTRSGKQATEIVLPASPGGHFMSEGAINGSAVRFMVDTGATMVAMSQDDARRAGVDWERGQRGMTHTANGPVQVSMVTLDRVRVGGVELNQVRAVIVPQPMPYVLLGNSFLSRFSMRRDADVMRLELRQ